MAVFQASSSYCSFHRSSTSSKIKASLHKPHVSVSKLLVHELNQRKLLQTLKTKQTKPKLEIHERKKDQDRVLQEMYAILNIVADREEMHRNIGKQRDNWNYLLLTSVNGMIATALTMAGLAAVGGGGGAPFLALNLSSTLLYTAVTAILAVMNKIQPSQLAEEQRNAARLFKQLHEEIKIKAAIDVWNPNSDGVKRVMEKVLALDKAYPLPLLGTMLDKFPVDVKPAVWWPKETQTRQIKRKRQPAETNGWDEKLEEEMREVVHVLIRKDTEEYLRLSKRVLTINRILAISGPFLTGTAAIGSALMASSLCSSFAGFLGLVSGALAIVVNTLEHGGQVGMVFEMYRSSAGLFRLMGENIESTVERRGEGERENGEVFEVKVALQLGRSLAELRDLANSAQNEAGDEEEEFASKLF